MASTAVASTLPIDPAACARLLRRLPAIAQPPWLHQEVARRMASRLAIIREVPERWLDWWGRWGGSAEAVAEVWPQTRRQAVEPTAALVTMVRQAARSPWWALRRHATLPVIASADVPPAQAPMLWANMVLHHVHDPAEQLAEWHRALAPDGFLMFSTLGPDTLKSLRNAYAAMGWPDSHAPFIDMHDIGDMLVRGGFADPVMDQDRLRLSWSSPQAALAELRELGMNLSIGRHPALRTRRWRDSLCTALRQHCSAGGRIVLEFELVFGHAYRGRTLLRSEDGTALAPVAMPKSRKFDASKRGP